MTDARSPFHTAVERIAADAAETFSGPEAEPAPRGWRGLHPWVDGYFRRDMLQTARKPLGPDRRRPRLVRRAPPRYRALLTRLRAIRALRRREAEVS